MTSENLLTLDFTFLSADQVREIAAQHGTPTYVYSETLIQQRARLVASMPSAFGLQPRFAMKACPSAAVLQTIVREGVGIDASSGFEVERAIAFGIPPQSISLTAQELPANLRELLERGVEVNACSLEQLRILGEALRGLPGHPLHLGVRFNPGLGSGHSNRTNVGGPSSGFGIWKDYLPEAKHIADSNGLKITRVHSHIGSGSDPVVWERCARLTLDLAVRLPDVTTVSLGGGFKVARMPGDPESDLQETGNRVVAEFKRIEKETGRQFMLEVEPGAFLMAPAGAVVSRVIDVVDTGKEGYRFIKADTGMTEVIRPAMYGAQHPIIIVPKSAATKEPQKTGNFLVIGHCCESGDIFTTEAGNAESLGPRTLLVPAIGDFLVVGSTGAYTSGFSVVNYNSFPQAAEVMVRANKETVLIRRRQLLNQVFENEIALPALKK